MTTLTEDVRRTLSTVRERVDSVLDRIRADEDESQRGRALARTIYRGPDLDIEETDDAVIVQAEVPGLRPEEISVDVTRNRLILRGEKSQVQAERGRNFHLTERRYGTFVRGIALPCAINPDEVKADYKDGILEVRLPKTEEAKGRPIRVNVRDG